MAVSVNVLSFAKCLPIIEWVTKYIAIMLPSSRIFLMRGRILLPK